MIEPPLPKKLDPRLASEFVDPSLMTWMAIQTLSFFKHFDNAKSGRLPENEKFDHGSVFDSFYRHDSKNELGKDSIFDKFSQFQ